MSSQPAHLLWVDLETTDTDPYTPHATVLEVGAIITRWEPTLPEVARARLIIRPPGTQADHDQMWARMLPVIQRMHHDNGLWREATTSDHAWSLTEADDGITGWLLEETGSADRVSVAGAGVAHLDLPFIKEFFPRLAAHLTYWPVDISSVRRGLQLAGRGDLVDLATDVDAKPHRGLEDVEMHVAEARRYLGLLGRLPAAEVAGS